VSDPVTGTIATCYRHPDRETGVRCQRCERPICPACMVPAPVGFQCVECVRRAPSRVISARSLVAGRRPYVTYVLLGVNVAVYAAGVVLSSIVSGGAGTFGRGGGILTQLGALYGPAVARGDWWRLVTSGFLHANIVHIAFNMIALYVLGQITENALGRLGFTVLYFTSLLAGSLGALIMSAYSPTVGASGAIFGLMGAAVIGQRSARLGYGTGSMMAWLVLNLVFTLVIPGISIGGHLGGLAGGLVCGVLLFGLPRWRPNRAAALVGCVLLAGACAAASLWWAGQLAVGPRF
jgi:membrane associated rhomboid family serine protease